MPCRRATASMLAPPAASARMLRISRSLLCRVPTRCPLPSTWPQGPARRGRYQREECLAPGERLRRGAIAANARPLSIRGVEAGLTRPRNALWRSRVALRTRSVIRPSAGPLAWGLPDSPPAAPPAPEPGAPPQVAREWDSTMAAETCAGCPENARAFSWWAVLVATPAEPWVLALMVVELSVVPNAIESNVAESEPPEGGRLPVSEKIRMLGCGLTSFTCAP